MYESHLTGGGGPAAAAAGGEDPAAEINPAALPHHHQVQDRWGSLELVADPVVEDPLVPDPLLADASIPFAGGAGGAEPVTAGGDNSKVHFRYILPIQ